MKLCLNHLFINVFTVMGGRVVEGVVASLVP